MPDDPTRDDDGGGQPAPPIATQADADVPEAPPGSSLESAEPAASTTEEGAAPLADRESTTASPQQVLETAVDAEIGIAQVQTSTATDEQVAEARQLVKSLLSVMHVQRVISVDDDYEGAVDELIGYATTVAATSATQEFAGRFDLTVEPELWEAEIRDAWAAMTELDHHLLVARARKEAGERLENDQPNVGALRDLFPEEVEFETLTPAQWTQRGEGLVQSAAESPTLLLIDRNMGDREDEGIRLAEAAIRAGATADLFVGLLTQTVDIGQEQAVFDEILDRFPDLNAERLVLVSKEHLGPTPESFPRQIKLILMTRSADVLREHLRSAIDEGVTQASEEVRHIEAAAFQQMIFEFSQSEGIWEPESLLRIFQLLMRKHVRATLYESEDVHRSAAQYRALCAVETFEPAPTPAAVQLYQAELYDFAHELNPVHLPIDLGDVFELPSGNQFVLLEQPCELMVRDDGRRGSSEPRDALVAQIKRDKPVQEEMAVKLPFFFEDGDHGYVWLNRAHLVSMLALDLTVFSATGESQIDVNDVAPAHLWPAWSKRYEVVRHEVQEIMQVLAKLEAANGGAGVDAALRKRIAEQLFHADRVEGRKIKLTNAADGKVGFAVKRVRRVLPLRARTLLSRYSLHRARDAFDYPLAREVDAEALAAESA